MPSLVFQAIPAGDCPFPYAQYFQRACIRWQQRHDIALPTHAFMAERFGLSSTKLFTEIFRGRHVPLPPTLLVIAQECGDSLEEHLTVANVDLAGRNRPPYDTFASLIRYIEHHMSRDAALRHWRDVLTATQDATWVERRSYWHDSAEKMLVTNQPPMQKAEFIVRMIEASSGTGGHAPSSHHRSMARA